jgi:hypothetical protein
MSDAPIKKKNHRRYVYMKWRVLVDPNTGEEMRALVACSNTDRRILQARKFRPDGRVRVEIKNPRHEGFHRLVHQFGTFLVIHVEGYGHHVAANGKPDSHAAVKDVQARSGAACERVVYDMEIPSMGMTQVTRTEPRSISFDEMDEDEFAAAFRVMVNYVAENDYPDLDPEQIADFESLLEQP